MIGVCTALLDHRDEFVELEGLLSVVEGPVVVCRVLAIISRLFIRRQVSAAARVIIIVNTLSTRFLGYIVKFDYRLLLGLSRCQVLSHVVATGTLVNVYLIGVHGEGALHVLGAVQFLLLALLVSRDRRVHPYRRLPARVVLLPVVALLLRVSRDAKRLLPYAAVLDPLTLLLAKRLGALAPFGFEIELVLGRHVGWIMLRSPLAVGALLEEVDHGEHVLDVHLAGVVLVEHAEDLEVLLLVDEQLLRLVVLVVDLRDLVADERVHSKKYKFILLIFT